MASLQELADEALKGSGNGEEMDVEKQIEIALECPCVADLVQGPCSDSFKDSFSCFMRSQHETKGMDCITQFEGFQACLHRNPEYAEEMLQGSSKHDQEEQGVTDDDVSSTKGQAV
eukprot:jgi/Picsp_1/1547/NSC_05025-R1_coiled-coil-helix-coiled-coil-helix domain-containing protein 4